MKNTWPALLVATAMASAIPNPAQAYQIDCAILLCLAGGFPASEPCARAKAEMIRRITPWPIEPPLQIWRCPMRASISQADSTEPPERLHDIALREVLGPMPALDAGHQSDFPNSAQTLLHLTATGDYDDGNGTADVDIGGSEYDFVRSIRVFSIESARQWWGGRDGTCKRQERVRIGTYGAQGDFGWQSSSVNQLPAAFEGLEEWGNAGCRALSARAVFVEWRDHSGNYGSEQVDY